ncbi:hypothetical protein T440DRAFT_511575 [Plenodomus tracheiphilus IPT5]|uniref:BZIP domain-containing protein n=1 Tax=Plenodomus tracheiphilus IPT5 TaxID=1408161 RepID=A0A6A7AT10_9PLEO|nr:hypothetical protein T440DRAFT_511575 [Plenodomus tracheiphilus IPT5]
MSDLRISHKAQNLARIRDNQRRSRARRKEYLLELEAKLRSCEQVGIEASSEIQTAARRVLDENRKLRSLLYERGASEPEIVAALGGPPDRPYDQISATPTLNAMLERRITTNVLSSTSSPASSQPHIRAASLPRHMPSVQPISIPAPRPTALSCNNSPSPGSIASSMGTSPPPSNSTPYYTAPLTPSAADVKSEDAYSYPYDQSYSNSWTYPSEYNFVADPVAYYNTSSCVDAANIIRTMRANAGPELEADLGCRAPGQHCYVNNNVVFNMMDKYSNQHATI